MYVSYFHLVRKRGVRCNLHTHMAEKLSNAYPQICIGDGRGFGRMILSTSILSSDRPIHNSARAVGERKSFGALRGARLADFSIGNRGATVTACCPFSTVRLALLSPALSYFFSASSSSTEHGLSFPIHGVTLSYITLLHHTKDLGSALDESDGRLFA